MTADGELIGVVADRTGLSVETIRFYEAEGLITPGRDGVGRRRYSESDITGLELVQALRSSGMAVKEIRQYVSEAEPAVGQGNDRLRSVRAGMEALLTVLDAREAELVRARALVVRWMGELADDSSTPDS